MWSGTSSGYDVLLQGSYFCDLIFTGLPAFPALGTEVFGTGFDILPGGTFNYAFALHRLGLRVGWDCDFGNDLFSRYVLDRVRQAGIDDRLFRIHAHPVRYVSVSISFPHDRAFVTYLDPAQPPPLAPLIEQYRPRCVLLPGLNWGADHLALCETAHRVGAFVYMDCQYQPLTLADPDVVAAIRAVDIFSPNASEALHLTGAASVEDALARLARLGPLVAVKLGAGGVVAQQGSQVIHVPGLVVDVLETTGAGDCFNAGFVYGYLRGDSLETCLRCGNICGGLSTTARGVMAVPTAAQVEEWLRSYPLAPGV